MILSISFDNLSLLFRFDFDLFGVRKILENRLKLRYFDERFDHSEIYLVNMSQALVVVLGLGLIEVISKCVFRS